MSMFVEAVPLDQPAPAPKLRLVEPDRALAA
jgi:hypothetical protein